MIEFRIYRAAFLPVLLAIALVMFSFESRPPALPQGLAADVLFEGRLAIGALREIVREQPDRRPGTHGNAALADRVAADFAKRDFQTTVDRYSAEGEQLENVIGRRPGSSTRQIVLMAARDGASAPDATGSAADTAALLELARVFEGRASAKTLVLVSVDGSTLGDAGARRFVEHSADIDRTDAVLVLSNLGARRGRGPLLDAWSNDASRGGISLRRTAAASLRQETGVLPGQEGVLEQLARLAAPLGIGAQGTLLEHGVEAIRFSGSGELPAPLRESKLSDVNIQRFGDLGRAVLRTASALDATAPERGARRYIVARNVLPGWSVSILALALIIPALAAAIDGFARARRRRRGAGLWWRWVAANMAPFVCTVVLLKLLALSGFAPSPPSPPAPGVYGLDAAAVVVIALTLITLAGVWFFGRPRIVGRADGQMPDAAEPGAGGMTALALTATMLGIWAVNPYAALVLAPSLHLWLLAAITEAHGRRGVLLVFGGLILPVALSALYLVRLSLGPMDAVWYVLLLLTGHAGPIALLLACALAGALLSVLAVVTARRGREAQSGRDRRHWPTTRGPGRHAGPGSLGAVESALRR